MEFGVVERFRDLENLDEQGIEWFICWYVVPTLVCGILRDFCSINDHLTICSPSIDCIGFGEHWPHCWKNMCRWASTFFNSHSDSMTRLKTLTRYPHAFLKTFISESDCARKVELQISHTRLMGAMAWASCLNNIDVQDRGSSSRATVPLVCRADAEVPRPCPSAAESRSATGVFK